MSRAGDAESYPLDHQGSLTNVTYNIFIWSMIYEKILNHYVVHLKLNIVSQLYFSYKREGDGGIPWALNIFPVQHLMETDMG